MRPRWLSELLDGVKVLDVRGDLGTPVRCLTHDSRTVSEGALFACLEGSSHDGHDFAAEAVRRGAAALLVRRLLPLAATQVRVAHTRAALARVAAAFSGHPSRHLRVVGVTGTNGKTTTTFLLRAVFEANGWPTGVSGTLTGDLTTPEAPDLQARMRAYLDHGKQAVAMEVSSHALELHRVDATRFVVAVFTNLDRDHLDFHLTMEAYFRAKARLFEPELADVGVVNADDRWGARLLASARVPMVTYSLTDAADLTLGRGGSTFVWRGHRVGLRLPALFNVANALAAATTAETLGVPASVVATGLSEAAGPPGRMERIDIGQPFEVLVDCAHTPSALEQVLRAARNDGGRLLCVFGCGGDRDPTKRPAMGEVATRLADLAVLTADNPRTEPLKRILAHVRAGVRRPATLVVEPDRRQAIAVALAEAVPGDVVLIAGKGDQTVQQIGGLSHPFDDRTVAARELARL